MAETSCIDEVIVKSGLTASCTGVWHEVKYGWADYCYDGRIVAKYLFTYTDATQWNALYEQQAEFASEIIEPVYFQLANDVSWNLYWAAVLDEKEFSLLDVQKRLAFASNTECTRNLVVPFEYLTSYIPVGRASVTQTAEDIVQPVDIWTQELEQKGLSFCLGEYQTGTLKEYVEGKRRSGHRVQAISQPAQKIQQLHELTIPKGFRPHCYPKDWSIPLVSANVLYGPNGTGKTSLLSAVEAALTGENCGITREPADVAGLQLMLETDQGERTVEPAKDEGERKKRERQWYQNRENNKTKARLNETFHQYNYFSAEEAYLFVSQPRDYRSIFTQILYGPSTGEAWRNINRYLEECRKYSEKLSVEMSELEKEQSQLGQITPTNRLALSAMLSASGLAIVPELPLDRILEMVQSVLTKCVKIQDLRPIPSQEQALDRMLELKTLLVEEKIQQDKFKMRYGEEIDEYKELQRIEGDILYYQGQLYEQEKQLEALSFYIENHDLIQAVHTNKQKKDCSERQLKELERLISQYGDIVQDIPRCSVGQAKAILEELQNCQKKLKEFQYDLVQRISQGEMLANQRTKAISTLRESGLRLYELNPDLDVCPLCGTEGISQSILLAYMEREQTAQSNALTDLHRKLTETEANIAAVKAKIANESVQLEWAENYESAVRAIQEQFPKLANPSEIFELRDSVKEDYFQYSEMFSRQKQELQALSKGQMEAEKLEDWESIQKNFEAFQTSVDDSSDEGLLDALSRLRTQLCDEKIKKENSLLSIQIAMKDCTPEKTSILLQESMTQISKYKAELSELKRIISFWNEVRFILKEPGVDAAALESLCRSIRDTVKNMIEYDTYVERDKQCKAKKRRIGEQQERCMTLLHTIEALCPPEHFAQQFIQQNIQKISQIFFSLHQPQEFSKLEIDPTGQNIIGYRGQETVSAERMSTGQRTALVLSVFFQMNLTAGSVPAFLLLDEPVANIDDLNVLALIDFLREFVITHHRQIVVTTANRNVAKLFRRKLSFLLQDFQELSFQREQEMQLQITKRCYSQQTVLYEQKL